MANFTARSPRELLVSVVASLLILAGLIVYFVVLRPWLAARWLVEERLREGRPIVAAVHEFQRAHGRWPDSLKELAPHQAPAPIRWSYDTPRHKPPVLSVDAGSGRRLLYGFAPRAAALYPAGVDHGWIIDSRQGEWFVAPD